MPGSLITEDWQIEYQGLLLGGLSSPYSVIEISGLLDLPDMVSADQETIRRHGLRPGDDFLRGRTLGLTLEVFGETEAEFTTAYANLRTALSPTGPEAPLVFLLPSIADGSAFRVGARVRRVSWPLNLEHLYRKAVIQVEFFSTDPRLLSNAEGLLSATLPEGGGGLTFDAIPNFTFGAAGSGGELSLVNSGDFAAPVVFRIDGPVQEPSIVNNETGAELSLSLTVASGDYILLDSKSRTVLLNGTASRYSFLSTSSTWFDLAPGSNSISFRGATTDDGSVTATWRSAWV